MNEFCAVIEKNIDIERPLWTVLIPTYNCARYLPECLQSVLQQAPELNKMEIIVVDDCSTDKTADIVAEIGHGRVQYIRQKKNVGKVRNYETGLQASHGKLIHILHCDDKVRLCFYKKMEKMFENHAEIGAAFCRSIYMDKNSIWTGLTGIEQYETGILTNAFERLYLKQIIQTPAMVVRREVYEAVGGFDRRFDCMEDWEMWTRIASRYPIAFINGVLAEYRTHSDNATMATLLNGTQIETHKLIMKTVDNYAPSQIVKSFHKKRNFFQAEYFTNFLFNPASKPVRYSLIKYVFSLSLNYKIIIRVCRALFRN